MISHFKDLYQYNFEINHKLLLYLKNSNCVPEKSLVLLSHLINAHQIWNSRILQTPSHQVWQLNSIEENLEYNSSNLASTLVLLENHSLDEIVTYSNSKGESFSNTVKDILFHIINHSTYHRAQIATNLKENHLEPLNTDYIFFKRNNS